MGNKFEELDVYKEAHLLVLKIYEITEKFPKSESFGLISQIRRAGVSIVANIVEGNTRSHQKEFIQFLYISKGSLEEVKYYFILTLDLKYISRKDYDKLQEQAEKVGKMLSGLIKYWRNNS